jgi:hypothetical protein
LKLHVYHIVRGRITGRAVRDGGDPEYRERAVAAVAAGLASTREADVTLPSGDVVKFGFGMPDPIRESAPLPADHSYFFLNQQPDLAEPGECTFFFVRSGGCIGVYCLVPAKCDNSDGLRAVVYGTISAARVRDIEIGPTDPAGVVAEILGTIPALVCASTHPAEDATGMDELAICVAFEVSKLR